MQNKLINNAQYIINFNKYQKNAVHEQTPIRCKRESALTSQMPAISAFRYHARI